MFIDIHFVNAFLRFSMTSMDITTIKNRPQPFLQVKIVQVFINELPSKNVGRIHGIY